MTSDEIIRLVNRHNGVISYAAEEAGIPRTTLTDRYNAACRMTGAIPRRVMPRRAETPTVSRHNDSKEQVEHRTVFVSDPHIPYHSKTLTSLTTKVVEHIRPDLLVLGGDVIDARQISRFEQDPAHATDRLQCEIDEAVEVLTPMINASKRTVYLVGNHEWRLPAIINTVSGMFGLRVLELPYLFKEAGLPPVEFRMGKAAKVVIGEGHGRCVMRHGTKYNIHVSWTVLQREYPGCISIQGHSHRPDFKSLHADGRYGLAYVSGHLLDPLTGGDYLPDPGNDPWTPGIIIVDHYDNMTAANVTQVIMTGDSVAVDGRVFRCDPQ